MGLSTDLGLAGPGAESPDGTRRTERLAREAAPAPVGLHEVRRERPFLFRKHVRELIVDLVGVIRTCQPQALRDAEHVGVDRDGLLPERVAEDHVRSLEPHARECDERRPRPWHFAPVLFEQRLRHRDDRAGLRAIKAGRADLLLERGRLGQGIVARRRVLLEEGRGDHVDPLVRALGRENRGDEELEWIPEVEGDLGVGIGLLQRANDLSGPGSLGFPRLSHVTLPCYGLAEIRMASGVISIRPKVTGNGRRLAIRGAGSHVRTTQLTNIPGTGMPPSVTCSARSVNGWSLAGSTRTRAATSGPGKLMRKASAPGSSFTDAVLNPFCSLRNARRSSSRMVARSSVARRASSGDRRPVACTPKGLTRTSSKTNRTSLTRSSGDPGRLSSPTRADVARMSTRPMCPRKSVSP